MGARVPGSTLFKAASRRRKPRSAACICSKTFRRTSASRISVGFHTLATVFSTPRYRRLPNAGAVASICPTKAFNSADCAPWLSVADSPRPFSPTPGPDILGLAAWPGLKPCRHRANGEDPKVVQELLRHSSIKITMDIYTQAVTATKRRAQSRVMELIVPRRKAGAVAPA